MPEETEFTFKHFADAEALEARVKELGSRYTDEEIAATAFYFGILAISGMAQVVPIYGDSHYVMHLMTNVYLGDWLTELIRAGSVDPTAMHAQVVRDHGHLLNLREGEGGGMEDIKVPQQDGITPMDKDTFSRLWGGQA